MERIVKIGGIPFRLEANGGLPRTYRHYVGGDIFEDDDFMERTLSKVLAVMNGKSEEAPTQHDQDRAVDIVENMAFTMNKLADPSQPDTVMEWLKKFDDPRALSDSDVIFNVIDLWHECMKTTSEPKKKKEESTGE